MMNFGHHTNNSQFFITFDQADHLDDHHVAFGKIVGGIEVLDLIEGCGNNPEGFPAKQVVIQDCGQL